MKNIISGKRIKELRETNNFTQSKIATFLGVDQSYIARVEKDERALSSDMVEKLASLFGVHTKAFNEDSTDQPLAYALRASELTEEDMDTISAINRIALNCAFLTSLLGNEGEMNGN